MNEQKIVIRLYCNFLTNLVQSCAEKYSTYLAKALEPAPAADSLPLPNVGDQTYKQVVTHLRKMEDPLAKIRRVLDLTIEEYSKIENMVDSEIQELLRDSVMSCFKVHCDYVSFLQIAKEKGFIDPSEASVTIKTIYCSQPKLTRHFLNQIDWPVLNSDYMKAQGESAYNLHHFAKRLVLSGENLPYICRTAEKKGQSLLPLQAPPSLDELITDLFDKHRDVQQFKNKLMIAESYYKTAISDGIPSEIAKEQYLEALSDYDCCCEALISCLEMGKKMRIISSENIIQAKNNFFRTLANLDQAYLQSIEYEDFANSPVTLYKKNSFLEYLQLTYEKPPSDTSSTSSENSESSNNPPYVIKNGVSASNAPHISEISEMEIDNSKPEVQVDAKSNSPSQSSNSSSDYFYEPEMAVSPTHSVGVEDRRLEDLRLAQLDSQDKLLNKLHSIHEHGLNSSDEKVKKELKKAFSDYEIDTLTYLEKTSEINRLGELSAQQITEGLINAREIVVKNKVLQKIDYGNPENPSRFLKQNEQPCNVSFFGDLLTTTNPWSGNIQTSEHTSEPVVLNMPQKASIEPIVSGMFEIASSEQVVSGMSQETSIEPIGSRIYGLGKSYKPKPSPYCRIDKAPRALIRKGYTVHNALRDDHEARVVARGVAFESEAVPEARINLSEVAPEARVRASDAIFSSAYEGRVPPIAAMNSLGLNYGWLIAIGTVLGLLLSYCGIKSYQINKQKNSKLSDELLNRINKEQKNIQFNDDG